MGASGARALFAVAALATAALLVALLSGLLPIDAVLRMDGSDADPLSELLLAHAVLALFVQLALLTYAAYGPQHHAVLRTVGIYLVVTHAASSALLLVPRFAVMYTRPGAAAVAHVVFAGIGLVGRLQQDVVTAHKQHRA